MNIYKLKPRGEMDSGDYYESLVVVAENEDEARLIHPEKLGMYRGLGARVKLIKGQWFMVFGDGRKIADGTWAASPQLVSVELIGCADSRFSKPQIILASHRAG